MWLGAKRKLGTTLLHLPLSVIRNAVQGCLLDANAGEVVLMVTKSDVTNNIVSSHSTVYKVL